MTTTALLPVASVPTVAPVRYRLATDSDGPAIGALFASSGLPDLGVDWTTARVGAWWYVAERGDEIIGAINFATSQPFGFIGDVVVREGERARNESGEGVRGRRPGAVAFMLYAYALTALRDAGSQRALGITDKPGLKRLLTRYGGVDLGPHTLFTKALR